ncbi:MAG TPA: type II toxin-antitoxin system death-on-curing family toxin [Verrucomicrobiae bacterium]|jgi:death-on-curing protein|nr:type II toxin-antitoxin system death-on-curing family toxin [Verrucomicrobiae bacterium]
MKKPEWVTREECLAIHDIMLAQHGGLIGLRDEGLLDSALSKPQHLFAYSKPTHAEMAASYSAGIILNHPFLDGNKRTGFMVAAVFLEVNGRELTATEESVVEYTLGLAAGTLKEKDYAAWLEKNSKRSR